MPSDFELIGAKELAGILTEGGAKATAILATALYTEGNAMMREAKEQIPFRTGTAKGSGRVFPPSVIGTNVTVELGFGGAASDYVEALHENSRGASFLNGKKDHYLSDPVKKLSGGLDDRILSAIRKII